MRKNELIAHQLSLTVPTTVTLEEGGSTVLTPVRWVPERDDCTPLLLDGTWEVLRWPFPATEKALLGPAHGDACWEEIQQPGKVFYYDPEQSPDNIPGWNRVTLAHIDPQDGAIIRRTLQVPAEWSGQRILLRFEGIYPAGCIYWDGELVAEQWSGLTRIEVDVTARAVPGAVHTVAVRLFRRHPVVQLDMPRHALEFTGLARSAFLHCVEPVHISDFQLQPKLAADNADGSLRGELTLRNTSNEATGATLTVQLTDAQQRLVSASSRLVEIAAGAETTVTLEIPAGPVHLWDAECPYLYNVNLRLASAGQVEQQLTRRIGFRRFTLDDDRPLLNGRPVKFRGVNHLTFHPVHGMYTPESWLRENLTLMKHANVNAIRTHFYGPPELASLCDELGLYLLQELPIDWGTDYVQDPLFLGPMLQRMEAGVRRDRNHPSVMVWCIGNENMPKNESTHAAFNANLRLCGQMVKRLDPTRPTMFPPPGPANAIKGIFEARLGGEIADTHYSFNLARDFATADQLVSPRTWEPTFETHTREELKALGWRGVWFSSEYGINNMLTDLLHAPYTSIIADVMEDSLSGNNSQQVFIDRLNREWGLLRDDPSCLGGAYFCWIAAGAGNQWGWVRWGEDADWGIVTGELSPKPSYWALRVLFSPVRFPNRVSWRPGETELHLTVHNDYNRFDLAECTLRTQMGGGPPYMGMLREWREVPMAGKPGTASIVTVPIWNPGTLNALNAGQTVLCRCTVLDPNGFRPIMADVLVFPEAASVEGAAPAMPIGPDAK